MIKENNKFVFDCLWVVEGDECMLLRFLKKFE